MPDEGAHVKRVLVIDDEPAVRILICEFLKMGGYHADAATSVQEAMQLFYDNNYELITLDFRMPDMDGGRLHGFLSRQYGHGQYISELLPQRLPPVLIVTGCASDPAVQALKFGENVVGIIEKPLSYETFSAAVRHILLRAEERRITRQKALACLQHRIIAPGHRRPKPAANQA
ncbi:MAG: response regulator [Planctomycetota bacterium]